MSSFIFCLLYGYLLLFCYSWYFLYRYGHHQKCCFMLTTDFWCSRPVVKIE